MQGAKVYVFRIDYVNENEFIRDELLQGRLRQGWGPVPLNPGGIDDYAPDSFVAGISARWPGTSAEEAEARYNILYPMLQMGPGDLVVVPKFPEPFGRSFAIAQVTGPYRFSATDRDDYGHCIPIDAVTLKVFDHDESLDAKRVSAKFTSYRRAVNNVWHEGFIQAVWDLWNGSTEGRPIGKDWTTDLQERTLEHARSTLVDLPPGAVEQLVAQAFEEAGYTFMGRHQFDRQGGDADLVLSVRLPLLSDLQSTALKVFVQVKKRDGEDQSDADGLEQLERIAADEPMALKVLFSTAPTFSEEAQAIAQEKGIILIGGNEAVALLARSLLRPAA